MSDLVKCIDTTQEQREFLTAAYGELINKILQTKNVTVNCNLDLSYSIENEKMYLRVKYENHDTSFSKNIQIPFLKDQETVEEVFADIKGATDKAMQVF